MTAMPAVARMTAEESPRATAFDVTLELERTGTLTSPPPPGFELALGAALG
jgi:hypothetical protein